MMKRLGILSLLVFTLLVIGMSGCNVKDQVDIPEPPLHTTEENTMLNERQKEILSEQGLPTEYDKLEWHQQKAIIAIDEMMSYLEEKYEVKFSYIGYIRAGAYEAETFIGYPSEGDKNLDIVRVTRGNNGMTDDYIEVVVRPIYNSILNDFINDSFEENAYRVYTTINAVDIEALPILPTDINGKVGASNDMFFDAAYITEAAFDEFIRAYEVWMKDNQFFSSNQFVLLENETVKYVSEYNYSDFFKGDKHSRRVHCDINEDGTTKVWE